MHKLGALDANFLYNETDLVLNHIGSVQRFALPEGVSTAEYISSLKQFLLGRLHLVPYMYRKLKFVPGNFDHPFWIDDQQVDIDKHVTEVAVEAPGDHEQLERAVARIHEVRMDRTRPLWHIHVLTGLEDGTIAYYNQVHHAAIDGMGGQAATMLLMDESPAHPTVTRPDAGAAVSGDDPASLMARSLENLFKYQLNSASRILGGLESMRLMIQRAMDPSLQFGAFGERAPRTRFNTAIGKRRSYATGEFRLDELSGIGKQLACTVNDVFMGICAGGLRRYLERRGELPETGLIAGCPVSLRNAHDRNSGNRVTMMSVNLATHLDDPRARLLAIHESAEVAKEVTADLSHGYDPDIAFPGLPAIMAMTANTAEAARWADVTPAPVNLVISNVPGPRKPLYCNGARMLTHYPVSIPAHGVGLNVTVQSYAGRMYFGVTACAAALPDPTQLRDDMITAWLELRDSFSTGNIAALRPLMAESGTASTVGDTLEGPLTKVA